jgi:D-sedoheptulose 7-phosphate isomerase
MQYIGREMINLIKNQILESIEVKTNLLGSSLSDIEEAANIMITSIRNKGKILWCGNGGSAADAQHLSTELMGGMSDHDRKPIPSISLVTDSSFLTAWSNDTDFESIFSRQVQGLGLSGDVLVGISTSGNSENIVSAIKQAKFKELKTIVLTGEGSGKLKNIADVTINVPSKDTQRIQESHIMIGQILCGLIEKDLLK